MCGVGVWIGAWQVARGGLLVRVRGPLLGRDLWWGRGCSGVMMCVVVGWVMVGLDRRCQSRSLAPLRVRVYPDLHRALWMDGDSRPGRVYDRGGL